MFNIKNVANELFGICRSFDYEVAMFDDESSRVCDPEEAVRFWTNKRNITIAIEEDGEDSYIKILVGNSVEISEITALLDSIRNLCTKYALLYNVKKYKKEITPRDFEIGLTESKNALGGSTKSSYLKLGGAKMIVRHSDKVNEDKKGARTRNISKIIIENKDEERFKMPTNYLLPAKAMTRHVSEGGTWDDDIGNYILEMADEQYHTKDGLKFIRRNKKNITEDLTNLVENARGRLTEIVKILEGLFNRYEKNKNNLPKSTKVLTENDDNIIKLQEMFGSEQMEKKTLETMANHYGDPLTEAKAEMINLPKFGCEVNKTAWEDFVNGKITLTKKPVFPKMGHDANTNIIKLQTIAQVCADDSISNLLSRIANNIDLGNTDKLHQRAMELAILASQTPFNGKMGFTLSGDNWASSMEEISSPKVDESFFSDTKGIIMSESIRSFGSWIDDMMIDKIFEGEEEFVEPVEEVFKLDVDDYLISFSDELGYPENSNIDANVIYDTMSEYLSDFDNAPIDDSILPYVDEVIAKIEQEGFIVDNKAEYRAEDEDISDDEFLNDIGFTSQEVLIDESDLMDDFLVDPSKSLEKKKKDKNSDLLLSDIELEPKDVIMPTNPQTDLKNELATDATTDDVNRILSLAGRGKSEFPRRAST